MRKIYIFAIAALGAFALASCSQEKESPVVASNGAKVSVTLGEGAKATMTDPTSTSAGFLFQTGDVINWISKSGNAEYTYDGPDAKTITFDVEIPGLDEGDVEGYFAVNFTDEVPYCYNASNPTQAQAGINPNCFFLSSYTKTLAQGSTSVSVDVKPVGGVFAFQFKSEAADKVFKVEVGAENTWCNNASFDGYALVLDPVMSKLATNVDYETSSAYDTQCVFVPVPSGITLDEPYVKIYAKSGMYTYDFGGTAVAPEGDLTFEDAVIKKIKLPLDESLCDKFEEYAKGEVELTAECISSNDPMQYVVGGSDIYGFQSNPDWFAGITGTQAYVREQRYGKATNLWDDDASTCYHTNLDWGQPNTSWGQRSYSINNNQYEKRYIQVTLPAGMNEFDLEFTNADSGREAEGLELLVTTDGSNWTKVPDTDFSKDFGAENSVQGVTAGGSLITALRIRNTNGNSDWTFTKAAFGIAELAIYGEQIDVTDPGKVTAVALDKTTATVYIGKGSVTLSATVFPATADVTDVVWTSSDPDIATVVGGVVTAVAEGNVTVTAKTVDGGFVATCEVTSAQPSAHMVWTVGEKTSEMQLLCPGSKRIKWNRHAYTAQGAWQGYLEIVQNDKSYYITDFGKVQSIPDVLGIVVAEATDQAGEDALLPCSGQTGTLYCWITDDGGWMQNPKVIAANTEMSFESSWDWSGATAGVTSTLEQGKKYLSIIYSQTSNSGKWKIFEVSETCPE